ncbi:MAG: hypothetical protein OSJ45_08530 [Lachnospiraceae bacterium]|nr:hypothetical protein [Lachnospiraceae bacterium]
MGGLNNFTKEGLEALVEREIDFEKLTELCSHITDAIQEILESCGLYFRIFSRVKSVESTAAKLQRGNYGSPDNPKKMQDLIGLRVVLYYYDDLSICRDIMESTFQMVDTWSRNTFNADEFRATKINGVFRYPAEYFKLYKKELWELPIDTTFEIQFRTVFFEGWHEIEHDMRYKSLLSDDQFWKGSEELSRMLNCILANLELSDWSLVKLFEELSYNHYKTGNWELMLKSKFRIKMDDTESLHPAIVEIFDNNKSIAKKFFKCSRRKLIRSLLKLDHPHLNYNLIIKLLNDNTVQDQEIAEACRHIEMPIDGRIYHKPAFARLESNILFHIELPLLHKETRLLKSEFNNAVTILYKWARFKCNPVFEDIPEELSSYHNRLPGYNLTISYIPEQMSYSMKIQYIDCKSAGTLWHVHSSVALMDDGRLHFYHMTSRDMPRGSANRSTFCKPSFMHELVKKTGLADIKRLSCMAHFITNSVEYADVRDFINNPERMLPVIVITQRTGINNTVYPGNNFKDGYDMNSFYVNGTRLAKVVGNYSHVYMADRCISEEFAKDNGISPGSQDGCIYIFWPENTGKVPDIFTKDIISNTHFDFNRLIFHDENITEKAFRHKLVQIIKDNNVSH